MTEHVASRTLVKSPPELWAECSDAASLARHLDQFGEIRITRLEPETAVAWEGERARGTVRIEPSGWGTKVILTVVPVADEEVAAEAAEEVADDTEGPPAAEDTEGPPVAEGGESPVSDRTGPPTEAVMVPEPADEPDAPADPPEAADPPEPTTDPPPRRRRFSRLFGFLRGPELKPVISDELVAPDEPVALEEPVPLEQPVVPEQPEVAEPLAPADEPAIATDPPPETTAGEPATEATDDALAAALDSLGQAHHRPYSRA